MGATSDDRRKGATEGMAWAVHEGVLVVIVSRLRPGASVMLSVGEALYDWIDDPAFEAPLRVLVDFRQATFVPSGGEVQVGAASLKATGVRSWPVLAGDQISTDSEGSALISSAAMGRIEVRKNSKVTVAEDHVSLQKGAVGSEKLPVRLRHYTVSAKDHGTRNWFVVADREGQVLVAAHRGDVLISGLGAAPLLVPAGSYAMPAPSPKKDKKDDNDKRKGGAATAGRG